MPEYRISRRECFDLIGGVCSQCGGPLSPIETVDNSDNPTFWPGCYECEIFCYGANPHIQHIAARIAEKREHIAYHHMTKPIDNPSSDKDKEYAKYYVQCQTSGLIPLVYDVLNIAREIGLVERILLRP